MFIFLFYSLILGASIGSFINVIVWRLPHGESVVTPRSFCPTCKTNIEFKYNIPIISWLFLSGKCKYCDKPISKDYIQIELLTAILFVLVNYSEPSAYKYFSDVQLTISSWFFISLLIPLTIIDLKYLWLPSSLISYGKVIGGLNIFIYTINSYHFEKLTFIISHLFTAAFGYLIFFLISYIGKLLLKKDALGMGDANLISMIGLWIGFKGTLIAIFLSFNFAAIYSLIMIFTCNSRFAKVFAFGPFITVSSFLVWHYGNDVFLTEYSNFSNYIL